MSVSATTDNKQLYDIVDQRIVPLLSKLEGVANVGLMGGEERQIRVNIDRKKLESFNLDAQQVLTAIESSNLDFPAVRSKISRVKQRSALQENSKSRKISKM
jgi:HAE1 family hydrophobic/amphiphilic exporter-1